MCRDQTGSTDKSTWGEVDFEPLIDGIHKTIAIQPHHQQRCENFVQMAALVSKTLVGEARRTWRATAISTLMRRFNIYAIEYKRGMVKDPNKRAKITRVTGNLRVCLFSTYIDNFIREVKEAREHWAKKSVLLWLMVLPGRRTSEAKRKGECSLMDLRRVCESAFTSTIKLSLRAGTMRQL